MLHRHLRRLPAVVAVALVAAVALPAVASARPFRGHVPWSVLLCKYSDQTLVAPASYFNAWLLAPGGDGVADYYRAVSGNQVDFQGSVVKGWYTMNRTLQGARDLGANRGQRIQDCVDAARAGGYTVPAGNRVVAIINGQVDSGSAGGRVLLDPVIWGNVAFAAHEMGHGMDLDHSYSDDPAVSYGGAPAEYDDEWDLMSAMHVFTRAGTGQFTAVPAGLNAEYRDRMGWLRRDQILTFGADGVRSRTVTLTNLYATGTAGIRVVRVPIDPSDPFHYYAVELRMRGGADSPIPTNIVRIYEVKRFGARSMPTTFLRRDHTGVRGPLQALADPAHDIAIAVSGLNAANGTATVAITDGVAGLCAQGYVWREASPSDHVCVTPAVRTQTRNDNAAAAGRRAGGGASGPDTCKQGFVWREAFGSGDHVCVTPATRSQARDDNAAAASRRAASTVNGPNTCKSSYVWREADQLDWVCVKASVRADVRADNGAAAGRHLPGSTTCKPGYVWREAYPTDRTCVIPARRSQARSDNAAAGSRLAVY
jgi:hypothetical protein